MGKDYVGGLAIVGGRKKLGRSVVREVAHAGKHTLLDRPWIGAIAQHFQVMVGLKQKQVEVPKLLLYIGRNVAQVRGKSHADAFRTENEADRIGGIVRDCEGAKCD